jgi:Ion channel
MTVDRSNINSGTIYMIVSICVPILAFSAAAGDAFSPFARYFSFDTKNVAEDHVLSVRLAAIQLVKLGEIVVHIVTLNFLGVVVSRFFHGNLSGTEVGSEWTWSESIYWSVQSTTTIGYGDLIMSDGMRLFQVFYLCLGTFFVGNTLGKLSNLKSDMEDIRRLYAWNEREVSKEMIQSDQADNKDPHVDQYEFVVASLLNLGKINSSDIKPIMDKFRKLAVTQGDNGYIDLGLTSGGTGQTSEYL